MKGSKEVQALTGNSSSIFSNEASSEELDHVSLQMYESSVAQRSASSLLNEGQLLEGSQKGQAPEKLKEEKTGIQKDGPLVSRVLEEYNDQIGYCPGPYQVEDIKKRRWCIAEKHFEYMVKWKGYKKSQNTWEKADNIVCQTDRQLLNENDYLSKFQRERTSTLLFDSQKQSVVGVYHQTLENHLKYADKEHMDHFFSKDLCSNTDSLRAFSSEYTQQEPDVDQSCFDDLERNSKERLYIGGKHQLLSLQYNPINFQLSAFLLEKGTGNLTEVDCDYLMKISPQVAIQMQKLEIAMIENDAMSQ